jgi:hypothetical protein
MTLGKLQMGRRLPVPKFIERDPMELLFAEGREYRLVYKDKYEGHKAVFFAVCEPLAKHHSLVGLRLPVDHAQAEQVGFRLRERFSGSGATVLAVVLDAEEPLLDEEEDLPIGSLLARAGGTENGNLKSENGEEVGRGN